MTVKASYKLALSGLEPLIATNQSNFVNVGERCNISGSLAFKKLMMAGKYVEAIDVAKKQVVDGANVIDINVDDGMLDGLAAMQKFVKIAVTEPEVAKVPFMLDASKFDIVLAGLKWYQGKCIVNSISLKVGEELFVEHATLLKKHGAAVVVMAFDEQGQAATASEKIRICKSSYDILVNEVKFPPEDIIFDPNVLTIDRLQFLGSIKRVAIFSNKTTHQIKLKLAGSELSLFAEDVDFANEASERLTCYYDGDDMEIGFNSRFLLEMLNNLDTPEVKLSMSEPSRAGLLTPSNNSNVDEDILMLVMPVMTR
jgi:cobalamin-dependent methionine synthase I